METISFYESIGRNLGDVVCKGVPTNCTATSLMSNALIQPLSNQLMGNELYFYSGGGAGQSRTITAFTPGSNHVVLDPQFDTVPSANAKFIVWKHFVTEDYESAMNRGIGKVRLKNLQEKVATLALVGTQFEYCVPSGFEYISNLRLVPSGNTDYSMDDDVNRITELPPRYWNIEPNALGSYMIKFDPRKIDIETVDGKWLNVVGQVKPDFNATIVAEHLQEYVISFASMIMSSQRISEGEEWRRKFQVFRDITNDLEAYIDSRRYGRRVGD